MSRTYHSLAKKPRVSRRARLEADCRLLIIGNGMVGAKFCEELVTLGLTERCQVCVIGDEPQPAYNRVKLSSFVEHRDATSLELRDRDWYDKHRISLHTGARVVALDRDRQRVTLADRSELPYDVLVFATGSRPKLPQVSGIDLPQVFQYRNLADLDKIISSASQCQSAAVVGGGLLGLEAAQALQSLGLKTSIIQRSDFLMTRQLTRSAGDLLRQKVEALGIQVITQVQQIAIHENGLTLNGTTEHPVDMVMISAGITPNSEVADEAGLPVGVGGGIVVNNDLETEDPHIFAIGECALLHGRIYGLAAPGYEMARHLARRLGGKKQRSLAPLELSTRLKMLGVDVVTIGEPLQEGRRVEFEQNGHYRALTLGPKRQLLGALGVGTWEENGQVHSAFARRQQLSTRQLENFTTSGELFPGGSIENPLEWSEERIVCNCTSTTKGTIVACAARCAQDPDRVSRACGASTVCGSCRSLVEQLCGASPSAARPAPALLGTSLVALVAVIYALAFPPAPIADSVQSFWYQVDQLWRDHILKQITGYSLMAIFLIGLILSLRKRLSWFKWGRFASWRFFHAAFGLLSLGALWAHTGFHFGSNLNWWLMFVFVMLNLLGAVAGIVTALEARGSAPLARRLRPILTWAHLVLFWPLPVLLTFHILSVYLY